MRDISFSLNDRAKDTLDPFDPLFPNHFPTSDPMVRKTRIYQGHRIVIRDPYNFWSTLDREDGKPLHASLVDCQFTTIEVIQAAIDDALKESSKEDLAAPAPSGSKEEAKGAKPQTGKAKP